MEDLSGLDQRPWKLGEFQLVARHLGQFNGRTWRAVSTRF